MAGLVAVLLLAQEASAHVFHGEGFSVTVDERAGAVSVVGADGAAIWRSGEFGLWQVRFEDGSVLSAADFGAAGRAMSAAPEDDGALALKYTSSEAEVSVTVQPRPDGVDLTGQVTPHQKVVLDFALPARLRFEPAQVKRFICPENGNSSVGTAFSARFFGLQPQDRPSGWRPQSVGPAGYAALFGGPLDQRADQDPPTALRAGARAAEWLPEALVARLNAARAVVNRPSHRSQVDLVVADSDNGPYFAASALGGTGRLWRL
ncbi:MAG: hypothetical protein FJX74_19095, partial [Armatimonadetes bacterium]|nr:hypothetical protein [Armatimonadota bacterium]